MSKKSPLKGGRKPYEPTAEHKRQAKEAAYLGLRDEDIAKIIGVSESTLQKYLSEELATGRAAGNQAIAKTAVNMAMSGQFPAMTIFLCKTRLRWRETEEQAPANNETHFHFHGTERPARYNKGDKDGTNDE